MTIAHYVTFFRILITPLFLIVYLEHNQLGINYLWLPYVLMILLGMSELTDAFDGYLARKFNQVTDLGKVLDPMADSIARISVFLTFTQDPVKLPIPFIFIFIYRDSVISTLRTICALKGFALAARPSGKIKAVIQAIAAFAVILLMIPHSLNYISTEQLHFWSMVIVGFAAVYTLCSGIEYIMANWQFILRLLKKQNAEA